MPFPTSFHLDRETKTRTADRFNLTKFGRMRANVYNNETFHDQRLPATISFLMGVRLIAKAGVTHPLAT